MKKEIRLDAAEMAMAVDAWLSDHRGRMPKQFDKSTVRFEAKPIGQGNDEFSAIITFHGCPADA